ncbi:MAG: hypothetical protein J6Z17_00210 [Treponema sp.]|nr:hypothetical protein [Treponema sp.]
MRIKVIGVGGYGTEIAAKMSSENIPGTSFAAVDTDEDELEASGLDEVLKIGENSPLGEGTGGRTDLGLRAAGGSSQKINDMVSDTDIVVLVCGLGGGTGTGAAPVIAKAARENGAGVCAVVKNSFSFEGAQKSKNALDCIKSLKDNTDSFLVFDVKFYEGDAEVTHHPESFELSFSKTNIQKLTHKITLDDFFDLIYSEIFEFVKSLAESSDKECLKSLGNSFTGYTARQNESIVYSVLGGLY